jgi:hypothetical protein
LRVLLLARLGHLRLDLGQTPAARRDPLPRRPLEVALASEPRFGDVAEGGTIGQRGSIEEVGGAGLQVGNALCDGVKDFGKGVCA